MILTAVVAIALSLGVVVVPIILAAIGLISLAQGIVVGAIVFMAIWTAWALCMAVSTKHYLHTLIIITSLLVLFFTMDLQIQTPYISKALLDVSGIFFWWSFILLCYLRARWATKRYKRKTKTV